MKQGQSCDDLVETESPSSKGEYSLARAEAKPADLTEETTQALASQALDADKAETSELTNEDS